MKSLIVYCILQILFVTAFAGASESVERMSVAEFLSYLARSPEVPGIRLESDPTKRWIHEEELPFLILCMHSNKSCPGVLKKESSMFLPKRSTIGKISRYMIYSYMKNEGVLLGLGDYMLEDKMSESVDGFVKEFQGSVVDDPFLKPTIPRLKKIVSVPECLVFLSRQSSGLAYVEIPEMFDKEVIKPEDISILKILSFSGSSSPGIHKSGVALAPARPQTIGEVSKYLLYSFHFNSKILYSFGSNALSPSQVRVVEEWRDSEN